MPSSYKNIIDFEILDIDNPKIIVFLDASEYLADNPELPILEITLPGFNNHFVVNITPKQINVLNANTIGITKTLQAKDDCLPDLPDGVYKFMYRICPYDKIFLCKYYLRTVLLNIKIKELYKLLEFSDCSFLEDAKLKSKLLDIDQLLVAAKAFAEDGNNKKASNLYQLADKIVNDLIKKLTNKC